MEVTDKFEDIDTLKVCKKNLVRHIRPFAEAYIR